MSNECAVCLVEFSEPWKLQNPHYCCNSKLCIECFKKLRSCPVCRASWELIGIPDGPVFTQTAGQQGCALVWLKGGVLHREGGPAYVNFDDKYQKRHEQWYLEGAQHRDDGPAGIVYDKNGLVLKEQWYNSGMMGKSINYPVPEYRV